MMSASERCRNVLDLSWLSDGVSAEEELREGEGSILTFACSCSGVGEQG